jgi:RNA polymerase sigma factor (sigma-70 family)
VSSIKDATGVETQYMPLSSVAQILSPRFSVEVSQDIRTMPDEALLELSLKNPSAFEAIVSRYQSQFLSRAQAVVRDRDRAEDVVQETFVRIYRFAPRFDGAQGNFRSWALTILMNVARTHYQRAAKDRGHTAPLDPEHYESLADNSIHAKEGNEAYAKEVITKALAYAPKDVAEILSLAFIDGLPHAEIAEKMGISTPAVKTRVHRAKAELRHIISEHNIL